MYYFFSWVNGDIDNTNDNCIIISFYKLGFFIDLGVLPWTYHHFRRFQTLPSVSPVVPRHNRGIILRGFTVNTIQIGVHEVFEPPTCFVWPCTTSSAIVIICIYTTEVCAVGIGKTIPWMERKTVCITRIW